jgi:hypothetical protein
MFKWAPNVIFSLIASMFFCMNSFAGDLTIDDRSTGTIASNLGGKWRLFTDQVMGGVSSGSLQLDKYNGRDCLRMKGKVSTDNNGGFVQMALDLNASKPFDATPYQGIELEVAGNNEEYNLHFRTSALWLPWQSYRSSFRASTKWSTVQIPFNQMKPYRTSRKFRKDSIKRIGLVAIGKNFEADLCLGSVKFYGNK